MTHRLVFFFLMVSLLLGCSGSQLETVEVETEDGYVEKYSRNKTDFAREGLYSKINSAGITVEEATYKRDTLHGYRILYSEKGDTQVVETYKLGLFSGPYKSFYENGQLELEGMYEGNMMGGEWRRYYDTGELMEVVTFRENEENGPFIEYFRNGNLKAEGHYLNGDNEHGELKLYNEKGELIRKMNCEHGVCRTSWKAESETQ